MKSKLTLLILLFVSHGLWAQTHNNSSFKIISSETMKQTKASKGGCFNSGFEFDQNAGGYNFFEHDFNIDGWQSCDTDINYAFPITVAFNDLNADASVINTSSIPFDPQLQFFGVNLSTVNTGSQAVRINRYEDPEEAVLDLVTMRRFEQITGDLFVFNYALVLEHPDHGPSLQPIFEVRLYDENDDLIAEECIISDPNNCVFNEAPGSDPKLLYTDWTCYSLDTSSVVGQTVRIEWSVSDCGIDKHWGYAYIDDICQEECAVSLTGEIDLNPIDGDCPDFPLDICATYSVPNDSMPISAVLSASHNGGPFVALPNGISSQTSDQICFTINETDLPNGPSGEYEFAIEAEFNISCGPDPILVTLEDESTNPGPDLSFESCCNEVLCPDILIDKGTIGDLAYAPGDTIEYYITVTNNEPTTTCSFTFNIDDQIDTSILDETTFNPFPSVYDIVFNPVTDIVSIDNIGLESGASLTFYFSFDILEDTLAEEVTNCAYLADAICIGLNEDCVTNEIVLPLGDWPRTYGGPTIFKRYAMDITTDDEGNIYSIGTIDIGDTSNEDSSFTSSGKGFVMKHDYFGNLVWIEYLPNGWLAENGSRIEYANNRLLGQLGGGRLIAYSPNGNFLSSYWLGPGTYNLFDVDTSTGDIYVARRYSSSYSNADFTVNATTEDHTVAIFKFDSNPFLGINYVDHQIIVDDPNYDDFGRAWIELADLVYAEDIDKLYLSGRMFNDWVFPNGQTYLGIERSFAIKFSSATTLNMDIGIYLTTEELGLLEFNNSQNKLYVQHDDDLYTHDADISSNVALFDDLFVNNSVLTDLIIEQQTSHVYVIGNLPNNVGTIARLSNFTPGWERTVDHVIKYGMATGLNDHLYVSGIYFEDTSLNNLTPNQSIFSYGGNWDIFFGRLLDTGSNGIYRIPGNSEPVKAEESITQFSIYPNPAREYFNIARKSQQGSPSLDYSIRDMRGVEVARGRRISNNTAIRIDHLDEGLYFVEIFENSHREIHKLILNK